MHNILIFPDLTLNNKHDEFPQHYDEFLTKYDEFPVPKKAWDGKNFLVNVAGVKWRKLGSSV